MRGPRSRARRRSRVTSASSWDTAAADGLTADLVNHLFLPIFGGDVLAALEDQATLAIEGGRIALTTDSFVVRPLFFPGGDIGSLAVHGTVNDLAVGGAESALFDGGFRPRGGYPIETLARIARSMRVACDEAGVAIVAGDTKVVERGKADGVFITTTGVGVARAASRLSIAAARPGDRVIVSGPIGDHGVAGLWVREGLEFVSGLESDSAPVTELARAVLAAAPGTRCMRDPTRGGLASALNELAVASKVGVVLREEAIPLRPAVRAACELFGLDPLTSPVRAASSRSSRRRRPKRRSPRSAFFAAGRAPPSSARSSPTKRASSRYAPPSAASG